VRDFELGQETHSRSKFKSTREKKNWGGKRSKKVGNKKRLLVRGGGNRGTGFILWVRKENRRIDVILSKRGRKMSQEQEEGPPGIPKIEGGGRQ